VLRARGGEIYVDEIKGDVIINIALPFSSESSGGYIEPPSDPAKNTGGFLLFQIFPSD